MEGPIPMNTATYAPTVIDRLNAEWATRFADVAHPWPHGTQTGIELAQTIARSAVEDRERIMRGLLEKAAEGDEDCSRAVLQLMLPRFTLIAGRHTRMRMATVHGDQSAREEVSAAVIAAAWKWIRRPSLHRAGSCIGNLAMDVLKDSLLERKLYDGQSDVEALPEWLPELAAAPEEEHGPDNGRATQDLCALVAWARDNATFSSRDAAIFLRYQLADDAERAALSTEYGYTGRGLCKRIHVLRARLTQAVKDYALERSELAPDYAALMQQSPA